MNKKFILFNVLSLVLGLTIGFASGFYFCFRSWQDFWLSGVATNASFSTHAIKLLDDNKIAEVRNSMINFAEQYIRIAEPYLTSKNDKRSASYKSLIMEARDILQEALKKNKKNDAEP